MRLFSFKSLMLSVLCTVPFLVFAQDSDKPGGFDADAFTKACVEKWMENTDKVTDKVEYKNFGEKYCRCMSTKPMSSDDEMKQSAQLCMSQSLLHATMDSLEDNGGLTGLTEEKIEKACGNKWDIVYVGLTGDTKTKATSYCGCAAKKLNEMNTKRDNMTDEDWKKQINDVARSCSASVTSKKNQD